MKSFSKNKKYRREIYMTQKNPKSSCPWDNFFFKLI